MAQQLSAVANLDEIWRNFQRVIGDYHVLEDRMIVLLQKLQDSRTERDVLKKRISDLEYEVTVHKKTIGTQDLKLKNVRLSLQKESEEKRIIQKDRDRYRNKVLIIAKMLDEDPGMSQGTPIAIKRQIYSSIQVRHLQLIEEDFESSVSGTEYEDDLDCETTKDFAFMNGTSQTMISNGQPVVSNGQPMVNDLQVVEVEEESFLNLTTLSSSKVANDLSKKPVSTTSLAPSIESKRSSITSCLSLRSILDQKKHGFVSKKVVSMKDKCNSCGTGLRILTQCYKCQLCHASVHPECREKLPLPCLAAVPTTLTSIRFVTVGKFCPDVRPRVPPVLVYCIQELESRKEQMHVKEVGETESRKLRDKLMAHKKGAPDLRPFSTSQLCGVIRSFLRMLDEPLITVTLWRHFARVAETKGKNERIRLLEDTLDQLLPPNRDTIAFIMKHLQNVLKMDSVQRYHLKRTFGPFIIGYSQKDLLLREMEREKEIQMKLMTLFLEEYDDSCDGGWEKVLEFESCKDALLSVTYVKHANDGVFATDGDFTTVIENNPRRGSSVMGGSAMCEPMTPLKSYHHARTMKPLF